MSIMSSGKDSLQVWDSSVEEAEKKVAELYPELGTFMGEWQKIKCVGIPGVVGTSFNVLTITHGFGLSSQS